MLNRRSFLGGLSASLPIVALPGAARAQAGRPRLHAMVVGINTYAGRDAGGRIWSLRGCLNDAEDIEQQVRRLQPASFRRLGWDPSRREESPVTRADFLRAWREMTATAQEGDRLLLTFSGHGFQVPVLAGNPSNERDDLDETLVLTGYDISQPRTGAEHIIDDELDELFRAAHAKGLIVVFAADCCHSGTAYRTPELMDVSYRTLRPGMRVARAAPVAPARAALPPGAPPNLLFLAGSQDDELVPEITVDGRYRGALSVAVARALEGRAAADGVVTAYGLARFVLGHVRDLSDAGQHPNVTWPSPTPATPASVLGVTRDTPLIVLGRARLPPPTGPAAESGPVRLRILDLDAAEQQRIVASLSNAALAGEHDAPSLIWDASRQLVLNDQAHRIAEGVDAGQLQHTVDRRRAVERLVQMSADNGLDVEIRLPGAAAGMPQRADATHRPGTRFSIAISGVADGHYYAVFNLTGNGKVQILTPSPYRREEDVPHRPDFGSSEFRTGRRKDARAIVLHGGRVVAQGPFGAEHVVVVASALPLGRLMPALVGAHETFAVATVMAALEGELGTQPLQTGFRGIYSARE
jgi:hypothetical protein